MKVQVEEVVDQLKDKLDLEATYMEKSHALIVRNTEGTTTTQCLVFWWAQTPPGVFDTDDLEESASISGDDGRLHTHSIEEFDVETMEEFLAKVKEVLSL